MRAGRFDRRMHLRLFVNGQVVEHDDVTWPERRHQHLFDVRAKAGLVDRPVKDGGRAKAGWPQGDDHGMRLPVPTRRVITESGAPETSSVTP